ncbi:MAG TPA: hypothetical protein VLH16_05235, partial [Bacteroidales bacterium]|nr:hypothetical protein [Bacteroidales bacterium]
MLIRSQQILPALLILLLLSVEANSQNRGYARAVVDTLASPFMWGRGYINRGDSIAAEFVAGEFSRWNLQPFR